MKQDNNNYIQIYMYIQYMYISLLNMWVGLDLSNHIFLSMVHGVYVSPKENTDEGPSCFASLHK